MRAHQTVIAAGPGEVRRLCCGATEFADDEFADAESATAALEGIDDPVVLVGERPVAVAALWNTLLRSLACPGGRSVLVVHPSWWSAARVGLIATAAGAPETDVVTRSRAQVLSAAAPGGRVPVVVEIAAQLVAITAAETVAEPRHGTPERVAEAVAGRVVALARGEPVTVVIDGPGGVGGAAALAALIAERLRRVPAVEVELADSARLVAAASPRAEGCEPRQIAEARRCRRPAAWAAAVLAACGLAVPLAGGRVHGRHGEVSAASTAPSTFLVEGRVALQVPEQWSVHRVTAGPGSARVEVHSPSDPQTVLHVTQSLVPGGTLDAAATVLRRAADLANTTEPVPVFVDFNPSGVSAGRPAVTYREVRDGRRIDWTVLVDGAVRISIGCQSGPDGTDAVRAACEQAIRSAHAVS